MSAPGPRPAGAGIFVIIAPANRGRSMSVEAARTLRGAAVSPCASTAAEVKRTRAPKLASFDCYEYLAEPFGGCLNQ
jgi:hypothetical protein